MPEGKQHRTGPRTGPPDCLNCQPPTTLCCFEFQSLQGDLKNLDLKKIDVASMKSSMSSVTDSMNKAFASYTAGGGSNDQEMAEYGLTADFIELVKGFSYMLFM